jgi:hypothetical protein
MDWKRMKDEGEGEEDVSEYKGLGGREGDYKGGGCGRR